MHPLSIEHDFDIPLSSAWHWGKQIQQNDRPVVAVHKCLARRPGTLRALFAGRIWKQAGAPRFFEPNDFPGLMVADPFMGGGTIASHRNIMARTQQRLSIGWMFEGEPWSRRRALTLGDYAEILVGVPSQHDGKDRRSWPSWRPRAKARLGLTWPPIPGNFALNVVGFRAEALRATECP
jgi:hypothetical protein